jgi:glycosyltransferase involved in cell wall biosynthesis
MSADRIGVVIIGRNEGARLIACFESFDAIGCEVVYVDSGSTDGSPQAAASRGASVVNLDLSAPFTAARARNAGYAALKIRNPDIQFIQFVDGDCVFARDWFAKARAFLASRPDVAVVCGRRRERHPTASVYNALCDIEWDTPIGETDACGGDALVRADAFGAVGGYRAQLIAGEEPELCLRLRERGWKIWRLDAEMTGHDAAIMHFSQWWARSVRCGHAYAEVVWLHRKSRFAIWKTNAIRAAAWGGMLPLVIVAAAMANRFALLGVFVYGLQVSRLALRRGPAERFSWIYAALTTLAKPAECLGMAKYAWRRIFRQPAVIIEYKGRPGPTRIGG